MVREELITSAISFLQDPSVAQAPLEKKVAFLQAKNLTQEEIDVSLARVGQPPASPGAQAYPYQPPPQQGPYGGAYQGYWPPPPPPELPKRDWRDWFIMATVMGGVGYGIYFTAKRYIIPLIKPPTPPQLEQDKTDIDKSFEKAFDLLEQLNTDTTALKAAEESRTTRLDSALAELESVLSLLKEADRKREDDSRRNADEIRNLRDLIPKAIEGQKDATDTRLKELGTELKSLRTLVGNRMGGNAAPAPANGLGHRATPSSGSGIGYTPSSPAQAVQPAHNNTSTDAPAVHPPPTNLSSTAIPADNPGGVPATAPASTTPAASSGSSRFGSGRAAAIPAWQLAAAKKSAEALNGDKKDTSSSGSAIEAEASST
ncbi:hypothetical protein E2P81_ATG03975 [Venturia nashicola]|uniref:Peroxisomal membrane protein PEX14 n=1 Tax=Venturia nashicola TaxID=86259 RepID=A0A4Z1PH87_9PEZI|nr:hypothetical protein E6O75_ATG04071 [Venturia nashicola]TLD37163.1 hypothetical protein E2P81_ATG03975 [Venturia nashicola]